VKESLHCVANASTGREHDLAMAPAPAPKHVLVVGGGAAGMEAARLLSQRGHRVTLWEASERLGGMLTLAGRADPLLDRYLGWLALQVERAGVDIRVGEAATADGVLAANADEVVLATGARWERPSCPGGDLPHVRTLPSLRGWLAADDDSAVGASVAVVGGGKAGLSVADLCLRRGRTVTIIEPTKILAVELGLPGRWRLAHDIEEAGADVLLQASPSAITAGTVTVNIDGSRRDIAADTVIICNGGVPNNELPHALQAAGVKPHVIGDCDRVAGLEAANLAAATMALAV
jgi:NADPH-dependent 2,4-dienoyl-CoA reductase/sulfur reductase-like enzyme